MSVRQIIEKNILKIAEYILPSTTLDRLLIGRRRKINNVKDCYPEAAIISKKRSDRKYCIVRYRRPTFDLMAAGIQYVFCYYRLKNRGYTPIIDIEYTYSFRQGRIGEYNIWDECFEQTISAKEASTQPYVIASGTLFEYSDDPQICLNLNNDINDHFIHVKKDNFREYYAKVKKYVEPIWKVKKELLIELDNEIWNKVKDYKILGVFMRENFSKDVTYDVEADEQVYSHHPLLPGTTEIIDIIKKQLSSWNYDYIFISTMYENTLEQFREEFGEKVICIERKRTDINDAAGTNFGMSESEEYEVFKSNMSYYTNLVKTYLKEIVALSRCDYLVGGGSSGMAAALAMNGGNYNDIFILEDARKIERY